MELEKNNKLRNQISFSVIYVFLFTMSEHRACVVSPLTSLTWQDDTSGLDRSRHMLVLVSCLRQ